ncbi:phage tail protein [Paenibacillus sp. IB182496]|uniref:Phage tail protein n=1 Tax=Paenibacillus sabuli TaxID=2772509 RepID=A0A927GQH7_9BACL|nr:tail fiber protein [Paenibacillus sabuli]MBD2843900.1 phage tail protein [Paenibacillus sabuli]
MDPYVGEIRLFAGIYAPSGWAFCNGSELSVQENQVLYSVIGNQYGGDGVTKFKLPNLTGSVPIGTGNGPGLTPRPIAQPVGESTVTLIESQMPAHTHPPQGTTTTAGGVDDPTNAIWGSETNFSQVKPYAPTPNTSMNPLALNVAGGSQPHNNMQPFVALSFIIALEGVYPQKSY